MTSRRTSFPGASPVTTWTLGIANTIVTVRLLSCATCIAGEEHLEGRRVLLHHGRNIDRLAEQHVLAALGLAERDDPGRDAGPVDEPDVPALLELVVERRQGALRFRRGFDGSQGVVIVAER